MLAFVLDLMAQASGKEGEGEGSECSSLRLLGGENRVGVSVENT
jgi:hypothetical protein